MIARDLSGAVRSAVPWRSVGEPLELHLQARVTRGKADTRTIRYSLEPGEYFVRIARIKLFAYSVFFANSWRIVLASSAYRTIRQRFANSTTIRYYSLLFWYTQHDYCCESTQYEQLLADTASVETSGCFAMPFFPWRMKVRMVAKKKQPGVELFRRIERGWREKGKASRL